MTTNELLARGIGHNCLSDAYELGRADAIEELKKSKDQIIRWLIKRDVEGDLLNQPRKERHESN